MKTGSVRTGFVAAAAVLTVLVSAPAQAGAGEWQSLFDGETFAGWQSENGKPVSKGWTVVDGCIHRESRGGNIVTAEQFEDFELELEWKVAPKANSKFKGKAGYGEGPGRILLQDHGDKVWYRNIRIRRL